MAKPLVSAFRASKARIVAFLLVLLLASSIGLQLPIEKHRLALGLEDNRIRTTSQTAVQFIGGLRSAAAAFLWIKVDRLHDDYYAENFSKEQELIPLYRLITWLDPHLSDAYYVGSYLLYIFDKRDESWDFAREGLQNNPDSSKMELNVGQLALFEKHNPSYAISHLKRAIDLANTDDDKLLALKTLEAAYRQDHQNERAHSVERVIAGLHGKR